jgi:hypothetical protein
MAADRDVRELFSLYMGLHRVRINDNFVKDFDGNGNVTLRTKDGARQLQMTATEWRALKSHLVGILRRARERESGPSSRVIEK